MTYDFPHESAYLPRTKLSYVNLPGILTDGKRDRAARVAGYVVIQLGERCYLVFLRGGEPFHSARMLPEGRGAAALSEVIRLCATESERGEAGQIGYFGAPEAQLQAMLSTLVQDPVVWSDPIDPTRPDRLFPRLREERFCGVVELAEGGKHHYLTFAEGNFRGGYFAGCTNGSRPVGDVVRGIFEQAGPALRTTLYAALPELPVQAGPGLVDLYRRIIGGLLRDLTGAVGRETAAALMRRGQALAALEHPEVAAFELTPEGRVAGDPVATPGQLTEGVAAWITESLINASDHHGVDPAALLEKTARDSRFVLAEHGFLSKLPWAVAL